MVLTGTDSQLAIVCSILGFALFIVLLSTLCFLSDRLIGFYCTRQISSLYSAITLLRVENKKWQLREVYATLQGMRNRESKKVFIGMGICCLTMILYLISPVFPYFLFLSSQYKYYNLYDTPVNWESFFFNNTDSFIASDYRMVSASKVLCESESCVPLSGYNNLSIDSVMSLNESSDYLFNSTSSASRFAYIPASVNVAKNKAVQLLDPIVHVLLANRYTVISQLDSSVYHKDTILDFDLVDNELVYYVGPRSVLGTNAAPTPVDHITNLVNFTITNPVPNVTTLENNYFSTKSEVSEMVVLIDRNATQNISSTRVIKTLHTWYSKKLDLDGSTTIGDAIGDFENSTNYEFILTGGYDGSSLLDGDEALELLNQTLSKQADSSWVVGGNNNLSYTVVELNYSGLHITTHFSAVNSTKLNVANLTRFTDLLSDKISSKSAYKLGEWKFDEIIKTQPIFSTQIPGVQKAIYLLSGAPLYKSKVIKNYNAFALTISAVVVSVLAFLSTILYKPAMKISKNTITLEPISVYYDTFDPSKVHSLYELENYQSLGQTEFEVLNNDSVPESADPRSSFLTTESNRPVSYRDVVYN